MNNIKKRFEMSLVLIALSFTLLFFQNCGTAVHESLLSQESLLDLANPYDPNNPNNVLSGDSVAFFESTLKPSLAQCASCHGANQQPLFAVSDSIESHDALLTYGLVDLTNPAGSRIVQKISGGHQGFSAAVSNELETKILEWATLLTTSVPEGTNPPPLPAPPTLKATFSSIHALILVPKCLGCHSPTGERPSEDYTNYNTTLNTGGIKPGDINDSSLYEECADGKMPENSNRLSNDELKALRDWINAGAPNN